MSVSPSLSSFSVPAQFSKIFSFARSSPTSCPRSLPKPEHWLVRQDEDADQLQTLAPEFLDLRNNLNEVKGKLNRLPLERWHRHTRDVNPAGVVVARVRREANRPELLTQAWCKFTECLNKFNLVREKRRLHSVHLCEAPGAFVAALNHHLCTQQQETAKSNDVSWKWVGNTLNPYYEGNPTSQMINDDRLVMHTTDKWEFGDDDTGDVLDYENRLGLKTRITERLDGIVDLVTADGSIDCQGDPANQEGIVSALHVAEVGIALNVLSAGGSFVLKMFTFFESQSGMLLYLLAASFDEVSAFKPATSKEGNSEVYVVCKGYRDNLGEEEKDLLLKHCHEGSRLLFPPEQVPKDFVKELLACSTFFKDIQCRVIEKNLDTFNNVYDQKRMRRLQDEVASLFVDLNGVRPLEAEKRLVTRAAVQQIGQCLNLDERVEMGTFEERVAATQNEAQKVALLRKSILSFRPRNWEEFQPVEWLLSENFRSTSELSPVYGKPCSRVASSKFCPSKVIEFHQMAVAQRAKDISAGAKRRKVEFSAAPNWRPLSELLDSSEMLVKLLSIYPDVSTETKVMCGVHYDGIISYPKAMSDYLQTVVNLLDTLERGDHLIACEVPLLRRLDVAALHMVANSFEEVGFVRPRGDECALFFSEFKGDAEPTKRLLKDVMRLMDESKPNRTLLQAKRIQELIVEPAYSYVVAFNLLCLKEKSLRMLSQCENTSS
jgi:cap2 methyltransferase